MNPSSWTSNSVSTWRPFDRQPAPPRRKTRKQGIQIEYIGFTPSSIAKNTVERTISELLRRQPDARVAGSVIAMRGGFEAFLELSVGIDSYMGGAVGIDWIRAVRRCVSRISEEMRESQAPQGKGGRESWLPR